MTVDAVGSESSRWVRVAGRHAAEVRVDVSGFARVRLVRRGVADPWRPSRRSVDAHAPVDTDDADRVSDEVAGLVAMVGDPAAGLTPAERAAAADAVADLWAFALRAIGADDTTPRAWRALVGLATP